MIAEQPLQGFQQHRTNFIIVGPKKEDAANNYALFVFTKNLSK